MMTQHLSWEAQAQKLFEEEWEQFEAGETPTCAAEATQRDHRLPHWLLPEVLRLLAEAHDRSVTELEPIIRELVAERQFVDVSGGPLIGDQYQETVDLHVAVFMRVLERVRQQTFDLGAWSDVPTTPQMFG